MQEVNVMAKAARDMEVMVFNAPFFTNFTIFFTCATNFTYSYSSPFGSDATLMPSVFGCLRALPMVCSGRQG